MAKRQTLDGWIREALTDLEKDAPCSMLSLVHMVSTNSTEVYSVKVGGGKNWTEKELAELLMGKAEAYSQALPGVQTFNLLAFYGKAESEAAHPFLVNGNMGFNGLATEGPTNEGQRQQSMRHLEMGFQQNYQQANRIFQAYENLAAAVDRRFQMMASHVDSLMKENHDSYEIIKEMMLREANNAHEHTMKEKAFERSSTERKRLIGMIPPLVNTVSGKEIFPQSTEDTALVEMITDKLTEENIAQIAAVLPPEVMGPLASRMQKYMAKKREERAQIEQAMRELPEGTPEQELSD